MSSTTDLAALETALWAAKWDASVAEQRLEWLATCPADHPNRVEYLRCAVKALRTAKAYLAGADGLAEKLARVRACRLCGCTHTTPCVNSRTGETCHWVARDLCSACAKPARKGRNA